MNELQKIAHEMKLVKPLNESTKVSLVPFTAEYREQYKQIYNACYHEMREALDIKPYDYIQDDSFFEEMDTVYLLLDREEIIGSVAIKEGEIDDLFVAPNHQGQGIGKEILLWALERMEGSPVILHVADWNKRAIGLYQKCGFQITDTFPIG